MKRILLYIAIFLSIYNCAVEDTEQIDYYLADTTMQIWSEKFNSGIKGVNNDTILLGVDSLLTWSIKVNTYIYAKTQNSLDTIIYGSDDFETWRNKFNYAVNDTNIYNINAITYFNREYEIHVPYKLPISTAFDDLDTVLNKIKLLYVFYGYSDSSTMHSWVGDDAISYPENQKPHFFRNSGLEGIRYGSFVNHAYANTNYNPFTEGIEDSVVYGIYTNDLYKYDDNGNQFGAYDLSTIANIQIGRKTGDVGFTKNTFVNTTTPITTVSSKIIGAFHLIRNADSVIVIDEDNNRLYNNIRTYVGAPDEDIYLSSMNQDNSIINTTKNTISYFYVAEYLTDSEVAVINNALNNYIGSFNAETITHENDYVQYKVNRVASINVNNPIILYQEAAKKLIYTNDTIYLSLDNGSTYPYKQFFNVAKKVQTAFVSDDNVVSFFNENTAYYSDDSLTSIVTGSVIEKDGTPFTFHTPVNPDFPGLYFNEVGRIKAGMIEGRYILTVGNYGNVSGGAVPTILWFSADTGRTWRVGYEFGQNPDVRDDGTTDGGTTGNLLGDAGNPIIARHIHDFTFAEDSIVFCTGDAENESKLYRSYFINDSTLSTDTIASWYDAGRFKAGGIHWENDSLTLVSDDNLGKNDQGVYRMAYANIKNILNHRTLIDLSNSGANLYESNDTIIITTNQSKLLISVDDGNTWTPEFQLSELNIISGNSFYVNIKPVDSDGWFSVSDNGKAFRDEFQGGTILIKIK